VQPPPPLMSQALTLDRNGVALLMASTVALSACVQAVLPGTVHGAQSSHNELPPANSRSQLTPDALHMGQAADQMMYAWLHARMQAYWT
jgi:hypothetical protein